MIGRGEITKAAQRDRVDAQTVERDYVLAHVATDIAKVGGERLVLKGGTSLRLAHFENYRYSADLDYSLADLSMTDALTAIADALNNCRTRLAMPMLTLDTDSEPPRMMYVGPLNAKPRSVKIDLADDELVIESALLPLIVNWRDLPENASIHAYSLTEICAEKLRCIIQRRQCRDLYDLWNVLEAHTEVDPLNAWHRFEQKASHKGIEPSLFFEKWNNSQAWYQNRWADELADYLGDDLPNFTTTQCGDHDRNRSIDQARLRY